jgi:hypothetical protein
MLIKMVTWFWARSPAFLAHVAAWAASSLQLNTRNTARSLQCDAHHGIRWTDRNNNRRAPFRSPYNEGYLYFEGDNTNCLNGTCFEPYSILITIYILQIHSYPEWVFYALESKKKSKYTIKSNKSSSFRIC